MKLTVRLGAEFFSAERAGEKLHSEVPYKTTQNISFLLLTSASDFMELTVRLGAEFFAAERAGEKLHA